MPLTKLIKFNYKTNTASTAQRRAAIFLFCATAAISLGTLIEALLKLYSNSNNFFYQIVQLFNTKGAVSVGFLFLLLLASSFLLWSISGGESKNTDERQKDVWYWRALSLIFFFLSVDELIGIHHKAAAIVERKLNVSALIGWLSYPWLIVYAPFLLIFGIIFFGFLRQLPSKTKSLFLLSGTITFLGAYLLEIPLAQIAYLYGGESIAFSLFAVFKRSFELFGVAIFLYALLFYRKVHLEDNPTSKVME